MAITPASLRAVVLAGVCMLLISCSRPPSGPREQASAPADTASSVTAEQLVDRTIQRRAVEAIIWGIPVVNYDVPVQQYWSATVYDRATHALVKDVSRASRASNSSEVQKNADGSVDVCFGPQAPQGKESNWVPTSTGGQFEVMFRLYGPEKALFDKTWVLPDIEKVQ